MLTAVRHWCVIFALLSASAGAADEPSLKDVLKEKVEALNKALIKEDFGKVADLTHPKIVKMMGGREKMVAKLESSAKEMKSSGYAIRTVTVDDPSEPVAAGPELYAVVPFELEMKAPGGKLLQKSFVIGVSADQGKSWAFVNGDVDIKAVKQVLPNLPEELKRPEKQKPVFKKE
jgi:hypothetical protein